jgi:hypothetical protein
MTMFRIVAVLLSLLLAGPAHAQYQTPVHSVPVGRGVASTGFGNAPPGAAGTVLTSNGTGADPTFQALPNSSVTTLLNAACSLSPSTCNALFGYYNAAWFGAVDDNSTDNTPKIQAAINAVTAGGGTGGGTLKVPRTNTGVYLLNTALNSFAVLEGTAPFKLECDPGVWLKPSSSITNTQSILYFIAPTTIELVQTKMVVNGCNIGDPTQTTRFGSNGIVFDTTAGTSSQFVQPIVYNVKITYANINATSCFANKVGCGILVLSSASNSSGGTYGSVFEKSMLNGGVNYQFAGDSNTLRDVFFTPDLTDANASNEGVYANLILGAGVLLLDTVNCQINNGCLIVDNSASTEVKNSNFEQVGRNSEPNGAMIDLGHSVLATTAGLGPVHIVGGNVASSDCTNNPFLIIFDKVAGGSFDHLRLGANCATYPHAMVQVTANALAVAIGASNTYFLNGNITTTVGQQYSAVAANAYKIAVTTP